MYRQTGFFLFFFVFCFVFIAKKFLQTSRNCSWTGSSATKEIWINEKIKNFNLESAYWHRSAVVGFSANKQFSRTSRFFLYLAALEQQPSEAATEQAKCSRRDKLLDEFSFYQIRYFHAKARALPSTINRLSIPNVSCSSSTRSRSWIFWTWDNLNLIARLIVRNQLALIKTLSLRNHFITLIFTYESRNSFGCRFFCWFKFYFFLLFRALTFSVIIKFVIYSSVWKCHTRARKKSFTSRRILLRTFIQIRNSIAHLVITSRKKILASRTTF